MSAFQFLALLACALMPLPGNAQVTASIIGTNTYQSGGVVADAKITVKSVETGAVRVGMTDGAGTFRFLSLPLGLQEVKVEFKGFKTAVLTGINLRVGEERVQNLTLEVAEQNTFTGIVEETPVVNTTTASISGMVDERQIKELPLNGRSFDDLIALNAGSINYTAKSLNTSTSNGNTFSVAGRRTSENLFLLNGVEYMGSSQLAVTPGGTSGYLLGVDGIREFNVLTDTYSGPSMANAPGRRSAPSRNPERIRFTELHLNLCATARSIRLARSIMERFLPFAEINSEALPADPSPKTACFCLATMKDSANRWT